MKNYILLVQFCFLLFILTFSIEYAFGQEEQKTNSKPILRDTNFLVEEYITDLHYPTTIDFIGNDLFILEKNGNVKLVKDGILQ